MNKRLLLMIGMGITLVALIISGVTFAVWMLTATQTDNNLVSTGCFDITFTEDTEHINITNTFPIPDSEGILTDPFSFTISNTCDLAASYQVNIEVLDSTTLGHSLISGVLDTNNPETLNNKSVVESTIANSTSYLLDTFKLNAGESRSHDFRMWVDYSATLENSQNKIVNSKIVIVAVPVLSDLEICLSDYEARGLTPTDDSYFTYTETSNSVTIDGYTDAGPKDVVIPCEINGKPVTVLGPEAFVKDTTNMIGFDITSAILPETLQVIDGYYDVDSGAVFGAFLGNKLTEVVIPNSVVEINDAAFGANLITQLTLGENVTTIGDYAFAYNQLTELVIPDRVIEIGNSAFAYNHLTELVIPDRVIEIGYGAFESNSLTQLTLGANLKTIGELAFGHNELTELVIPDSVAYIGSRAFESNSGYNSIVIKGVSYKIVSVDDYFAIYALEFDDLFLDEWAFGNIGG